MSVEIKKASVADAEEILLLQKLAYRSEAELCNNVHIEPLTQTLEQLQSQFDDHIFLKAVADEIIVGSVRASVHGETCCIGKLMVHPDYQNRGLGNMLMRTIEDTCPQLRYELFTGNRSEKKLAIYRKLGYEAFREEVIASGFMLIYLEKNKT